MSKFGKMYSGSTSYIYEELDEMLAGCIEAVFVFFFSVSEYVPAQIYGPPENCYPAEGGGVEDLQATLVKIKFSMSDDKDGYTITLKDNEADGFFQYLCAVNGRFLDTIEEQCREEANNAEPEYDEDRAYDRWRDGD